MPLSRDQFDQFAKTLPGLGRDPASVRQRIEAMEGILERLFVVPGINRSVGLDSIVQDAVTFKFTAAPLTKDQLAELMQIPPR